jgi:hypothetical protein
MNLKDEESTTKQAFNDPNLSGTGTSSYQAHHQKSLGGKYHKILDTYGSAGYDIDQILMPN